ncbi:beta 1-4 rhamnosyltransferase Cps2T [Clostridium algidicarnis]|uniref:beta 1-4 rhamnosyltransferase Cps2T n=1 Tax=Clostridium algidicarnis TaxID=37659 RepID=UPI00162A103B|nr:DUF1972 domain-containing protein [Clostridium algidicarnis]MBB6631951.1 DUF1972 domain-containing protein [Clostridium algidicarnis]
MKHIFIIGSKGIPASYGGFETFVDKLVSYKKDDDIQYYVSCLSDNDDTFNYNGAICFNVDVPKIGSAKAVMYDILSLKACIKYIEDKKGEDCIVYILACRIGPFMSKYKRQFEKMGVRVYINPDGHEWKRSKWNVAIKRYWKLSEKLMIKHTDLAICDSKAIEKYIIEDYKKFKPKTTYISYGADIEPSFVETKDKRLIEWFNKYNIRHNEYYLVVGRFVPENNYETIIKEFVSSNTKKDLVIITNNEENAFYKLLIENTKFNQDKRVKFVGTLYDDAMLKSIRKLAYGYIHGHEVGGTNPSLLEALSSTKINMLFNVQFNKEVAEDGALYFSKNQGELKSIIEKVDALHNDEIECLGNKAKKRIKDHYSWDYIVDTYEDLWMS